MTLNWGAEDAELELDVLVEKLQKKYRLSSETVCFLLRDLSEKYNIKSVAERMWKGEVSESQNS